MPHLARAVDAERVAPAPPPDAAYARAGVNLDSLGIDAALPLKFSDHCLSSNVRDFDKHMHARHDCSLALLVH
jgi:hypothetical protein